MPESLREVHNEIASHCADIADLFKPGAKVTVIVRNPSQDKEPHSAAMTVGDDDFDHVAEALECLRKRGDRRLIGYIHRPRLFRAGKREEQKL